MNRVIEINIKNNKTKMNGTSYKNIIIYDIEYVTVKGLSYPTMNSVNPVYLIINKRNGYIEESNGNIHLMI